MKVEKIAQKNDLFSTLTSDFLHGVYSQPAYSCFKLHRRSTEEEQQVAAATPSCKQKLPQMRPAWMVMLRRRRRQFHHKTNSADGRTR